MGEAKIMNGLQSARMPDSKQVAAMEAKACQFADALLAEGYALAAPDKRMMAGLLVIRAASKVVARLAMEEGMLPSVAVARAAKLFPQAVEMAIKGEILQTQRLAVAAAAEGDR